jgi:hypothetical protein
MSNEFLKSINDNQTAQLLNELRFQLNKSGFSEALLYASYKKEIVFLVFPIVEKAMIFRVLGELPNRPISEPIALRMCLRANLNPWQIVEVRHDEIPNLCSNLDMFVFTQTIISEA